ncbi:MAG TPA: sigma-E processing peptidase SpoIIGA [Bacillota bacterium]|nr:sigma-E processing peptidase SpoIIGA [Bacillota bacterium]
MEGVQYVYFEKVVFVNLSMNWLILWVTGRLSRADTVSWRLLAGAFLGALYSFALLVPDVGWLVSFAGKMVFSLLMVAVTFFPLEWSRGWRVYLYFYITSFTLGGAIIGLGFLMGELEWWLIPAMAAAAYAIGRYGPLVGRRVVEALGTLPFKLVVGGREKELVGYLDTGNQVREPFSRFPVLIVEAEAVAELLPPVLLEGLLKRDAFAQDPIAQSEESQVLWDIIGGLEDEEWLGRWRVIPFRSVGRPKGFLLGFRPDYVEYCRGNKQVREKEVIVGLYQRKLSNDGSFLALLPADWLNM